MTQQLKDAIVYLSLMLAEKEQTIEKLKDTMQELQNYKDSHEIPF